MSYELSPQIIQRVESFCNEVLTLVERCYYMADFNHTGFGTVLMETSGKKLQTAAFAIAESVSSESVTHGDFCPLDEPCHYLLPQALMQFMRTGRVVLGLMQVMSANVYIETSQRLAYEYLAHTLNKHSDTASFILETVAEELPEVEGLKVLDTFKFEARNGL